MGEGIQALGQTYGADLGRQNWSGWQSGVPGCGQVNDNGGVHRLIVHSAHGRVHIGGGPVRHDAIPWKVSTHLSDHCLELSGGCSTYQVSCYSRWDVSGASYDSSQT